MPESSETIAARVGREHRDRAVARLVGTSDASAVRRFIDGAPGHGIDLSLMWGVPASGPPEHVCLAVHGTGRTAMLFLSGARRGEDAARVSEDLAACVRAAWSGACAPGGASIVQALPELTETFAIESLSGAGLERLGNLSYLKRPFRKSDPESDPGLPKDVRVVNLVELGGYERAKDALGIALERTYIDTLDCPGLCGLREIPDVLESHRAVGRWDPAFWWLVFRGAEPEGCVLLNHCPELRSIELVYLGLSPALRGEGLGRRLMIDAIRATSRIGARDMTCAVDQENYPALQLYESLGFSRFSERAAFVGAAPGPGGA